MKQTTIAIILLFFSISISAQKTITLKIHVQDEYGRPLNGVDVFVKRTMLSFFDSSFEVVVNEGDTIRFQIDGEVKKDTVLNESDHPHVVKLRLSEKVLDDFYPFLPPEFIDKSFSLKEFITENVRYPEDALRDTISGVAHVRFKLNGRGERDDYSVFPSVCPSIDQEAIRLVKLMPKMFPVINRNKYLTAKCFLPVQFNVKEYLASKKNDTNQNTISEDELVMPVFPGGEDALVKFFKKNCHYPEEANKKNIASCVKVLFSIDESGAPVDITILESGTPYLDEAAINMIKKMPRWIPAKNKKTGEVIPGTYGIPFSVRVKFTLY